MFSKWINRVLENRHFQYGVPFFCFVIGAPFILKTFNQIRYDYRATKPMAASDKAKYGLDKFTDVRPEDVYQKEVVETEVPSDYQMIRGPRNYEPASLESYKKFRAERIKEKKKISFRKAAPEE